MMGWIAVLGGISLAMSAGLPPHIQKTIEVQIRRDLQQRAQEHRCQIAQEKIHFGDLQTHDPNGKELIYDLAFDEKDSKGVSHYLLKKKVVLNQSWKIISITPLEQKIQFENGADISL
jgi:hypothetical protein